MRIAVPDLVSNSYFPVVAAATLGAFAAEGIDISLELRSPLPSCMNALRDGGVDFVGASAHAPLLAFPDWRGAKLLCAQSQGTYWFLVMRKDLDIARGDLAELKGKRIAAVPFVGAALRQFLLAADMDPERENVSITMPEEARKPGVNFGVFAARALRERSSTVSSPTVWAPSSPYAKASGPWFSTCGEATGQRRLSTTRCRRSLTTDRLVSERPDVAASVVRAIIKTQLALKRDFGLATAVGRKLYPQKEAELIADVVARDLPFYDPRIGEILHRQDQAI